MWGNLGETRGGWKKVACWGTKAAISLKRVKIEEKLLWRAYKKSQMLFRTVPSPTPYGLPFPKIGGSQPHPKTPIAIISGTAKATVCKFGRSIHRVHPNTSPRKILEKRERGHIQGLPIFFEYPLLSRERKRERGCIQGLHKFLEYSLLSQDQVKLRTSNLAGTFTRSMQTKAH